MQGGAGESEAEEWGLSSVCVCSCVCAWCRDSPPPPDCNRVAKQVRANKRASRQASNQAIIHHPIQPSKTNTSMAGMICNFTEQSFLSLQEISGNNTVSS